MTEFFVVKCNNPNKVKLLLSVVRDIKDKPEYNSLLVKECSRIDQSTNFAVSINFGVITSVTCENIHCPFNALNTDSELTV